MAAKKALPAFMQKGKAPAGKAPMKGKAAPFTPTKGKDGDTPTPFTPGFKKGGKVSKKGR